MFALIVSTLLGLLMYFGAVIAYQDPTAPFTPGSAMGIGTGLLLFAGFQWWARRHEK